jgi:hypothetical protein
MPASFGVIRAVLVLCPSRRRENIYATTGTWIWDCLRVTAKEGLHRGRDFFVSYTQTDRAWAEWIAWVLEEDGHQVLIQAWDFVPGSNWLAEMQAGTRDAARTIAVLSGTYLGSVHGSAEWQAAMATDPDGTSRKLLIVRVADCQRPGLLAGIVGVDLFGISEAEARDRLRQMVAAAESGRAKPAVAPGFPGAARIVRSEPHFPGGPHASKTTGAGAERGRYAEQPANAQDISLPPANPGTFASQDDFYDVDLVLRSRLLLPGPRGRSRLIGESARAAVLTALDAEQSLTSSGALDRFLQKMDPHYRKPPNGWVLQGRASAQEFTARWQGSGHDGRTLATALLHVKLTSSPAHGNSVTIRLDTQLTNPGRPRPPSRTPHLDQLRPGASQGAAAVAVLRDSHSARDRAGGLPRPSPRYKPFIDFRALGHLMLGILGTLWGLGPPGEIFVSSILGQAIGPPAQMDLTIAATQFSSNPVTPTLDKCIDFGNARLIRGNTPGTWTQLGPIQPDRAFSSPAEQERVVREWLIHFGVDNGYENVEEEVNGHEPQT